MASFAEIAARQAAEPAEGDAVVVVTGGVGAEASASSASSGEWSKEGWEAFEECVFHVMGRWPTLEDALTEQWGGASSAAKHERLLRDVVLNCRDLWRARKSLHWESIDTFVFEVMLNDFNVEVLDRSIEAVSALLVFLGVLSECVVQLSRDLSKRYKLCSEGRYEEVLKQVDEEMEKDIAAKRGAGPRAARVDKEDDDDDDDDEEEGEEDNDDDDDGADEEKEGGTSTRGPRTVTDDDGWTTVVSASSRRR
jgi:hypothetical protein